MSFNLLPSEFNVSQNYPNPFNPSTRITYNIPQRSNVSLKIYDVLGKEIVTLVNEEKEAGTYDVQLMQVNFQAAFIFIKYKQENFLKAAR